LDLSLRIISGGLRLGAHIARQPKGAMYMLSMYTITMPAVDPKILFGRQLQLLRTARGMSQEYLADEARLHRTFIGQVERGKTNISLLNIMRLAQALRVPPAAFFKNMK
jgi:DNA-binding XRE family transcriptional regulator